MGSIRPRGPCLGHALEFLLSDFQSDFGAHCSVHADASFLSFFRNLEGGHFAIANHIHGLQFTVFKKGIEIPALDAVRERVVCWRQDDCMARISSLSGLVVGHHQRQGVARKFVLVGPQLRRTPHVDQFHVIVPNHGVPGCRHVLLNQGHTVPPQSRRGLDGSKAPQRATGVAVVDLLKPCLLVWRSLHHIEVIELVLNGMRRALYRSHLPSSKPHCPHFLGVFPPQCCPHGWCFRYPSRPSCQKASLSGRRPW